MSVAAKKRCKYPATQELFTYLTGLKKIAGVTIFFLSRRSMVNNAQH